MIYTNNNKEGIDNMNKINNRFLGDTFISLVKHLGNSASGYWLKHNTLENDTKRLEREQQLSAVSDYKYFRSWCSAKSATF
jgi:hypothetical protein